MNNGAIEKRQSWKEQYALDIPSIDKQHMHFFKLFDKIIYIGDTAHGCDVPDVVSGKTQQLFCLSDPSGTQAVHDTLAIFLAKLPT